MSRGTRTRFPRRLRLDIAPEARDALDDLAERHDRVMSDEVRIALKAHLRRARAGEAVDPEPIGTPPWGRDTTIVVREETADELTALAEANGRSVAAEARMAIDTHLRGSDLDLPSNPSLLTA